MWIVAGLAGLGVAVGLVLNAFQSNLVFFFTPSQVAANEVPLNRNFRVGGLVEPGSIKREKDGLTVHFKVTDSAQTIPVVYTGLLPDLFREGYDEGEVPELGDHVIFLSGPRTRTCRWCGRPSRARAPLPAACSSRRAWRGSRSP